MKSDEGRRWLYLLDDPVIIRALDDTLRIGEHVAVIGYDREVGRVRPKPLLARHVHRDALGAVGAGALAYSRVGETPKAALKCVLVWGGGSGLAPALARSASSSGS